MKRYLSLILAAIMLLSVGLPLIPTVSAEETPDAPVNFAASLIWNKTVGSAALQKTDTGAAMTNLANSWDSGVPCGKRHRHRARGYYIVHPLYFVAHIHILPHHTLQIPQKAEAASAE